MRNKILYLILSLLPSLALATIIESTLLLSKNRFGEKFLKTREAIWEKRLHQIQNLPKTPEIVLLGDSTLKAGIDDKLFSTITGKETINLGLTGDMITYGDYAILKRLLKTQTPPEYLIFWHTVDVWPRDLNFQLFLFTNPSLQDIFYETKRMTDFDDLLKIYKTPVEIPKDILQACIMKIPSYKYKVWMKNIFSKFLPLKFFALKIRKAPITSKKSLDIQLEAFSSFYEPEISAANLYWLKKLVSLSDSNKIKIFLARSPIHENFLKNNESRKKMNKLNNLLNELANKHNFIKLNTDNPGFEDSSWNADKDHAGEKARSLLTKYYANLFNKATKGQP